MVTDVTIKKKAEEGGGGEEGEGDDDDDDGAGARSLVLDPRSVLLPLPRLPLQEDTKALSSPVKRRSYWYLLHRVMVKIK